jgi:hypothetical protein
VHDKRWFAIAPGSLVFGVPLLDCNGGVSCLNGGMSGVRHFSHSLKLLDSKNCRSGAWSSAKKMELRICLLK